MAGDQHLTVEGDLINRCELFDEADLDAALARFDELSRPAPRLENAASRTWKRAARRTSRPGTGMRWHTVMADDDLIDDRRRVVMPGHARSRRGDSDLRVGAESV